MDKPSEQMAKDSPVGDAQHFESLVSAYEGRLRQSRQESIQAVTLARQSHLQERAALFVGAAAVREALYGYSEESTRQSLAAGRLVSGRDAEFPPAFALALSRNSSAALTMVTRMEKEYPEDTRWRLARCSRLEVRALSSEYSDFKAMDIISKHEARLKRSYSSTLKDILELVSRRRQAHQEMLEKAMCVRRADIMQNRPTDFNMLGSDFTVEEIDQKIQRDDMIRWAQKVVKYH
jgi:hypothetical protein